MSIRCTTSQLTTFLLILLHLVNVSTGFYAFPKSREFRWSRSSFTAQEYGEGMDQNAMMESDVLIVVDENDVVVSDVALSKKVAHSFNLDQPRGVAHRAFSFFIFNKEKKLLLTKRATSKITFPGVWTNTACSHPLHGMFPNEVDLVPAAFPKFPGIKHAAIRKLKHELGIDPKFIPHDAIQFVSRFHYWAADTITYGPETPWGEHEIDYVLFLHCLGEDPVVISNPEEVSEFKYVSMEELKDMFDDQSLQWSPWFRGIMEAGGFDWWRDLEDTMAGKNTDDKVHYFDPPIQHYASYNNISHSRTTGVMSTGGVAESIIN